jgi:hypothetical protein
MNFKKLAIAAAAGAMILGSTVPAFAFGTNVNLTNNAFLVNKVKTAANVSNNYVSAAMGSAGINTVSVGAVSDVKNDINSSLVSTCNTCSIFGSDTSIKNNAVVMNTTRTTADVSRNYVSAGMFGNAGINTGSVGATGVVSNSVNFTMIGE